MATFLLVYVFRSTLGAAGKWPHFSVLKHCLKLYEILISVAPRVQKMALGIGPPGAWTKELRKGWKRKEFAIPDRMNVPVSNT